MNSRPITMISENPNDLEALTPNYLLLLQKRTALPPGLYGAKDIEARHRWKKVKYLSDLFWTKWAKEYLTLMHQCQKWNHIRKTLKRETLY